MKINPHDPAYPVLAEHCQRVNENEHYAGLPIRLELAARFMAAELANSDGAVYSDGGKLCKTVEEIRAAISNRAIAYADALIAAYNEGQE